ncbi:MAG TPA: GAF domain-containing protein, partial [Candidatus Limnocylindria bacterium]|nr:GAF domain-containing protein [Candidatus Limnocylindria bacterium]
KQAVIAIENVRLFNETKEALEQQTAVGDVLKTISRSAFDLQPVLDIVLNNAVRLAGADIGWLSRVENDQFTTVAYSTEFPQAVKDELVRQRAQGHIAGPWIPLGTGGGLMGFTLAEGRTVHLPDVKEDPELKGSIVARLTESRTVVGVPMLRDGRSIGGMVLARYAVRPFSEREIELVQTFADQAAIAIENMRLFNETKEALQRQSAVSEVLKTISGTVFDLDPTLQTVVENAAKLADADVAWMMHSIDSKSYTWGPRYGRTPQNEALFAERPPLFARAFEIDRARGSIVGRVYAEARTIEVSDAADDAELLRMSATVRATKSRSLVGVPVLSEGVVTGAIILGRETVRPFSEREVQLVETFANQAAIAIRNVRLFNEIQDKSRQLEVASRHKSEFLANMSHELRTPLNAIIGFSEVLIQGLFGEVNEKQRDYLQDVIGSGQHLLSLINDILDLSKIEAGRMELELSTFSFRSALQSGVTIVRERAARNGITLNVDVSDELDRVEADERKVKQILYNLLSNAVKFTPDGGNVNVTARRDNGDVRVDVQDNGIGIAEADQARIFEEFQQVGRERSREGTGLGLTLTKRFVELHGGRIWLESAPGKGSRFTFTLPLRQAAPVRT